MARSISDAQKYGRPTLYRGIEMRSRLEASWAAYLDKLGREWTYEPCCFADESRQYLPDFLVSSLSKPLYIELKGALDNPLPVLTQMSVVWKSDPTATLELQIADGRLWSGRTLHTSSLAAWNAYDQDGNDANKPVFMRVRDGSVIPAHLAGDGIYHFDEAI